MKLLKIIRNFLLFIRSSLVSQFFLIIFSIILLLIIFHAMIIWWGVKNYFVMTQKHFASEIVRPMSYSASQFLNTLEKKLGNLKMIFETVRMHKNDMEVILSQLSVEEASIQYLSLMDSKGLEICCSEPLLKLSGQEKKELLQKTDSGQWYQSDVLITPEFYPLVKIAVRVCLSNHDFYILYAEINLTEIWELTDNISRGSGGNFFIVSKQGVLCAYKDKKLVMKNEDENSKLLAKAALSCLDSTEVITLNNKEQYLISSVMIEPLKYYLVYQKNLTKIISEIYKITWMFITSSLGVLLFALVIVFAMCRRITSPILNLAGFIPSIGEKFLIRSSEVENRMDEIGRLYHAFYDMNEKIMESKARERLAVIGESAMGISHEIKNPVTAIKNFSLLLIESPQDNEIFKHFCYAVPKELKRIESLLGDLSHLSLDKKLERKMIDLDLIIEEIRILKEKELTDRHIQLIYEKSSRNKLIFADHERMESVFRNILDNSIAALPDGGYISIEIDELSDKRFGKFYILKFEDNGAGISEDLQKKIFDPFFTTKKKGLGLGLALSKGIIEQHGGVISVFSAGPGKGAVFTIKIPSGL